MIKEIQGVGTIEMHGEGPWTVTYALGGADFYDSNKMVTNPTVNGRASVVFTELSVANRVRDAFNADFEQAGE